MSNQLIITPKTKIGELLSSYPQLEETLMQLSPAFKKLKNPLLRKTIGKVATLQQAASIGNMNVNTLVNSLRKQIGQLEEQFEEKLPEGTTNIPEWFSMSKIKYSINAIPVINSGNNPMEMIFKALNETIPGEILEFKTPFVPSPILEKLKNKKYKTYSIKRSEEEIRNYVLKTN